MKISFAGESHGRGLMAIVEGLPQGLFIDEEKINGELLRRSVSFGRGERQKIESDRVQILSGVMGGRTIGSPLAMTIENRDFANWEKVFSGEEMRPINCPRPGHADYAGMLKFKTCDARPISERASARSTAIKVALGALCRQYLEALGVFVTGFVRSIGKASFKGDCSFEEIARGRGELLMMEPLCEKEAKELIENAKMMGDTLGGTVEIRAKGLKAGFGSCMQDEDKLDARIAFAFLCVQAIKGVEFGAGFALKDCTGESAQDELFMKDNKIVRKTNRAGGIEGGMSNGEEIVVRAVMKPLPTLQKGLKSIDFATGKPALCARERADVCAVPAVEVVLENVLCYTLLDAVLRRLGGDRMEEVKERYEKL